MISNRLALALGLASLLAGGCGSAITGSIAHPARVGRVMPHSLVRHDRNAEGTGFGARLLSAAAQTSARQLPAGALDDAIRLVRFDEAGICFDLLSRHTAADDIDFRNGLHAELVAQPGGAPTSQPPMVVASPPRAHTEIATQQVTVEDGWTSGCDEDGCWSHATYGTETQNVAADVYESRALFCFANDGTFTPATEALELRLPHGRFRWEFDAPASSWAQPIIVMEPVYAGPTNTFLGAAPPVTGPAVSSAPIPRRPRG